MIRDKGFLGVINEQMLNSLSEVPATAMLNPFTRLPGHSSKDQRKL